MYIFSFAIFLSNCSENAYNPNTIIVDTSADNPPYEFLENNKIIGLDIDIINAIADRLGKKIVIRDMPFYKHSKCAVS